MQSAWTQSTNGRHANSRCAPFPRPEAAPAPPTIPAMSRLDDLADRIERLVLRHEELKRTNALLQQQVEGLASERDSLRSRLAAARARIDALLDRLPPEPVTAPSVAPALLHQANPADDAA